MKQFLELRRCFKCGADKTEIFYKTRKGKKYGPYEHWRYDKEGNITCQNCYNKAHYYDNLEYNKVIHRAWKSNNPEYVNIHRTVYLPRSRQLRRIRTAMRRGWGKID